MSIAEMCWGDVGLLLSMPRQGLGNSAIASVADDEQLARFDGTWAAMAITEPGIGSDSREHPHHRGARRRPLRPQRREDLRHLRRAGRQRRRVGDARQEPRPGGDQVVRGREGHARHGGRAARAQARHPRLRHRGDHLHRLPGAEGEPARLARGRRRSRASPARWRPSTTPGRWSPRWRSACARAALDLTRDLLAERRGRGRPRPARPAAARRRGEVPAARGRLGGRPAADAAGGLAGRQPQAQLAGGLDGQGEGRAGSAPTSRWRASSCAAPSATPRPSCSRSGRATPRSSTSSRAPSRSSS